MTGGHHTQMLLTLLSYKLEKMGCVKDIGKYFSHSSRHWHALHQHMVDAPSSNAL